MIPTKVTVGHTVARKMTITPVQVATTKRMDTKTMLPSIINKEAAHVGATDEMGDRIN